MIEFRVSVCAWLLALAWAGCDPVHTIGSELGDAGLDGGPGFDGGPVVSCSADGGCSCGFACGFVDDIKGPACIPETVSCAADGGAPSCADGGVCLAPVVSGDACPIGRCFVAVGAASCTSDSDCPCGFSCAENDVGAAVCAQFATCLNELDCKGGDCVAVYRNGVLCTGIKRCLNE